jgi:hypothetical protein
MRSRNVALAVLAALSVVLPSSRASADDRQVCDAAYDQAQTLRDAKKLVEARDQLRVCASTNCAASVVKDCTAWLAEIEPRVPSVVLVADDAAGSALANVTVTVDGGPPRPLDGTSLELDPGTHAFTFVGPDGTKLERTAVVVEGQKARHIVVQLEGQAPTTVPPPVVPPTAPAASPFPWKPIGYATAGVGAAGLIVGGIFGGLALGKKGSDCPAGACVNQSDLSAVQGLGNVSTIGFVVGGVLAAAGVTMVLLAPAKGDARAASVEAAPLVGAGGAGLAVSGTW